MTDATATLYGVTSFDGCVFPLGDYRWVIRGVVIGVGAAAAACALVTSVTVAATWIRFRRALHQAYPWDGANWAVDACARQIRPTPGRYCRCIRVGPGFDRSRQCSGRDL